VGLSIHSSLMSLYLLNLHHRLVEPEGPSFTSGPIGCVERSYSNPDGGEPEDNV
jgi:hypothetical protein